MDPIFFLAILGSTSISIIIIVYLFLKRQSQKEQVNLEVELKKQRQEFFLPNRVDAYERAILLLERLHPNSLVMRLNNPSLPAKIMQAEFLKTIREEFDHNITQQLFISPIAWKLLRDSKEELVKLINLAASQVQENATAIELSAKIFELVAQLEKLPSEVATEFLKKEFQELF
ncbi:MAG: hypothetical protein NTY55_08115 [Flavobacteriia bacterium]|nr:hypothetical protein [Flavobacteriia bacterium]